MRVCWEFLSGCLLSSVRDSFLLSLLMPCFPFLEIETAVFLFLTFFLQSSPHATYSFTNSGEKK